MNAADSAPPKPIAATDLVEAMALPIGSLVGQRVPKGMLVENGAATPADRKLIQDHVEALEWVAALKPTSIGVLEYRDDAREYVEIAVMKVRLRQKDGRQAKISRISELIHRAIPYPILLILDCEGGPLVSLSHVRWAQREAGQTVLDGELILVAVNSNGSDGQRVESRGVLGFMDSLKISALPRTNLKELYQGWIDVVSAWQIAAVTGTFALADSREIAQRRREVWRECLEIDKRISNLKASAAKQKQMAGRVEVNMEIASLVKRRSELMVSL